MSDERPVRLGYRPNTRSKGDEPTSGISRKTVGDVFTNLKHSNNHHLCSLWMWLVGQNASALVYRLPSVLASIGTIVLAGVDRFTPIPACGMHRGDSHVMVVLVNSFRYGGPRLFVGDFFLRS
jgi:hypothetical protein